MMVSGTDALHGFSLGPPGYAASSELDLFSITNVIVAVAYPSRSFLRPEPLAETLFPLRSRLPGR